ncbi:glycosyltransferase family 2 protein [Xylaria bambusicola]|uniref:glycosyltransferase family 2 protein n=1 Tax=Xylaria bambusicola TaxID=326684 RepID=UPI0020079513|nr:glycosyltransferase family 2 protein [Xylaria bambusicola]KAI0512506.1 glycosyltransferase family 2 protein [Xylaria bambusicola]
MDSLLKTVSESWMHLLLGAGVLLTAAFYGLFVLLHLIAPKPRAVLPSEKTYITTTPKSKETVRRQLPCWHDRWLAERRQSEQLERKGSDPAAAFVPDTGAIEPAEVLVSVVFPAYNEEKRILPTLEEAVEYLDATYGRATHLRPDSGAKKPSSRPATPRRHPHAQNTPREDLSGYEILIVNDGSSDKTVDVALQFAREHDLHDVLRIVTLEKNRGKGGGVTHGLRHVRGAYALFADADGASRFSDLGKLVEGCEEVVDGAYRGLAIGSRGHLVGSEAVVKRSALRNFLMRSFHLVLTILTPPATSRIRDTQCGFKLFSRAALPHIVPYMHAEGWIFDIEMLMLAESAPAVPVLGSDGAVIGSSPGIKVAEVPIDWHEVDGSKLNVIQDSIKMAVGLAVLRASWMMGVYRRRLT